MSFSAVLIDLLEHINSTSEPVIINWDNTQQWPSGALDCLIQAGVIISASSAQSLECSACENRCFMDVLVQAGDDDLDDRAFIVCDDSEMQRQMGRIQIPLERLQQWKTGYKQLAGVVAGLLNFNGGIAHKPEQDSIRLGMLKSKGGRRWVSLFSQPLELEINGYKTPVNELLFIENGELIIDRLRIDELLNTKPLSVGKSYVPTTDKREAGKLATLAKHQDWQDEYASLLVQYPEKNKSWFSRKISRMPIAQGADSETIRKHLK